MNSLFVPLSHSKKAQTVQMNDHDDIIQLNSDALDLMSNDSFVQSLPLLEEALSTTLGKIRYRLASPQTPSISVSHHVQSHDLLDENDKVADIVIEMVDLNEDGNNPGSWNQHSTFMIYDKPCFFYGGSMECTDSSSSMDVDGATEQLPSCFLEKSIAAILFNIGLSLHLAVMKDPSLLGQHWLQKALSIYGRGLKLTTAASIHDDDYMMLSLALLNNMVCVYLHISQTNEADLCLQELRERLALAVRYWHTTSDAFKFCQLNVAAESFGTTFGAPMA